MQKTAMLTTVLGLGLLVPLASGCSKSESKDKGTKKEAKPAAAIQKKEARPEARSRAAKPEPMTYKTVSNDKIGFSIQVPSKAKTLACDEYSCTYSQVLPDGMFEIHVNVAKAVGKLDTIADAIRDATTVGQKAIADKKALSNGDMLVVKAPQGALQEVWYYAKGPKGKVRAKCSGPSKMLDVVKKVCTSLKAK